MTKTQELQAQIEALKAEKKELMKTSIEVKVADKSKQISVYFGGRYPLTATPNVWGRIFDHKSSLEALFVESEAGIAELAKEA